MSREVAHLSAPRHVPELDVLGPTIEFLTEPDTDPGEPCLMRGSIPPGGVVPLHSHPDPETFIGLSGDVEGLAMDGEEFTWVRIRSGDIFHVPGSAKHAFRNPFTQPAVQLVVSTAQIGRFFREIARPLRAGPPSADTLRDFRATAARYGHWNATPGENAAIGLRLDERSDEHVQ
jgi:quercetin dioxygenase-like cupin family protein